MASEQLGWWHSIGNALRLLTVVMFFVLLTVIVADVYTYAYASHYLAIPIVLGHAQPTLVTLGAAALAVLVINAVIEFVPRFRSVAVMSRLVKDGTYVGLASFEAPLQVAVVIVLAYLVIPAAAGKVMASTQTTYQVVQLTERTRNVKEAIIVTPTVNGVLLALLDRARNAVIGTEMVIDTLGPNEPRLYRKERIGHLTKR